MAQETVQDLQADKNALHRLFQKFSIESTAVSISGISLVIAALALLMAFMAVYDAMHAKIQIDVVLESNADLKKEVRLLEYKVDLLKATVEARGNTDATNK